MRKAIMTYIVGGYDTLKDPAVVTPGWDYLCFSDVGLGSDIWRPIPLDGRPLGVSCPKRRSSLIKILHHQFVDASYDVCITVDGSLLVNCDLDAFLEEFWWGRDAVFAVAQHPRRSCLYAEAEAVLERSLDDPKVVQTQVWKYAGAGFPRDYGLFGTRMMVKNNRSKRLREMCERWAEEYQKGSRRDQLSLTYALWRDDKATGARLPIQAFDFEDVYRNRKLFAITEHLGSQRWQ
jgi:hypothetical protein